MSVLPRLIAHADWGQSPDKRWLARAALDRRGRYMATAPEPVGDVRTLVARLRQAAGGGAALVGFDFPIGLPGAYADRAGIDDFLDVLPRFGEAEWSAFYDVATRPDEIALTRPFYPMRPGGTSRARLVTGLGLSSTGDLLRACDRAYAGRPAAAPIFWTLGAQQVGKGAIAGWRDVLGPALRDARVDVAVWPFSGGLGELLQPGRVVAAETYPAECYGHLGIDLRRGASNGRSGKRWAPSRAANASALRRWARTAGVALGAPLTAAIEEGFGTGPSGDDQFDAVVGLLGMLNVVLGGRSAGDPKNDRVRRIEGWIFGQAG